MKISTQKRRDRLIDEFQKLLRSGFDYAVDYMYSESADRVFLSPGTAGNIVREHYRKNVITDEMIAFAKETRGEKFKDRARLFSEKFYLCARESRLILLYLIYDK